MINNLLLDDKPIYTTRSLAIAVGINESQALWQLHSVIKVKEEHQDDRTLYEGVLWCKYTLSQWQEKLPWMSEVGIRKMLKRLETVGVLLSCQPNARDRDQTKWYRIDYDRLNILALESAKEGATI